ncbi:tetratricopeptide repeat protein [Corallococcus silvisoli]|uniref:tetratricopeptide repeat protein n=1 Tax=Corallococcus silvisoli TaxID=2697031 RepID=UPI0013785223|nr:tetratricopeptide repeat protein [Corallococcus silvisoli]NBD11708.1 hypothetical protein [Corallococcus silvisoli]
MRRGITGLALIAVYLISYQYFARGGANPRVSMSPQVVIPLLVAVFLTLFAFFFWRIRRWGAAYHQGVSFFGAGDEREAAHRFEEAARRSTQGTQRAVSVALLGQCMLALGDAPRALELFGSAERSHQVRRSVPALYRWMPNLIAMAYFVQGDGGAARAWLEEGRKRANGLPPTYALLPEVGLLCREGRHAAAVAELESRTAEADMLVGRDARRLKLLRAFALDSLDPATHAAAIDAALSTTQPTRPDDFDMLSAHWPELRAFMERKGIPGTRAA